MQRKQRGWKGFIVPIPNCTVTGLAIALKPLADRFGLESVIMTSMQGMSGAGRSPGVIGLDILDSYNVGPTLTYVAEFKRALSQLHVPMPTLWGLHNYSDTNRFTGTRTKQILDTVPGNLWLTETGGVVQFGTDFTNVRGSGLRRAARALEYMYKLAYTSPRIQRLYIYNWFGETSRARFDAGIMDRFGHPRLGYVVVCDHQLHYSKRCHVHVNND